MQRVKVKTLIYFFLLQVSVLLKRLQPVKRVLLKVIALGMGFS